MSPRNYNGICAGQGLSQSTPIIVGASLLAKAPSQSTLTSQTYRFREQARSHRGFGLDMRICEPQKLQWDLCWTGAFAITSNLCGSELARESAKSVNTDITDLPLSRASSLPQRIRVGHEDCEPQKLQWDLCWTGAFAINTNHCGSELAREGAGSVNIDITDLPLSRASSLPQGIRVGHEDF